MRSFPTSSAAPHILVIDDDPEMVRALTLLLESCGYAVSGATGGDTALQLLVGDPPPDIVLTDIYMPEMDGFALINAIRQRSRLVPIIAMSGGSSSPDYDALDVARKLGADGVIEKPFRQAQIVELLDRHIGPGRRGSG